MIPYIICFAVSAYLFYKASVSENVWITRTFLFLSVFVVAFFAGIRDYKVGVDVLGYGLGTFQEASIHQSYFDYSLLTMLRFEPGYLMLNFLASRLVADFHIMLFLLMFLQMLFMEIGLLYFRKEMPVFYGYIVFLLFYFNTSLNTMRQMLALAIIFFAFRFVVERRLLPFLLWVAIASLFHISAWGGVCLYPLYVLFAKKKTESGVYIAVALLIGGMFGLQQFIGVVLSLIGLPSKYSYYFSYATHGIFVMKFLFSLPFLIAFFCLRKKIFSERNPLDFFLFFSLCLFSINTQAREWIGMHAERGLLYFSFFHILALPRVLQVVDRKYYVDLTLLLSGYSLFYWYYYFICNGYEGTMPYTSLILSNIM